MKKIINTAHAPAAVGPYSQGNAFGNLVFTSGQLPLNPETMKFPEGGIKEQAAQALENLKAILEAADADFSTVLKVTCYLDDINDFADFNEVYTDFFGTENAPARSCFEVGALPMGALVEIEAIAYRKES